MSNRIMSQIWDAGPEDKGELLVLLALADFANDEGECWPAIGTLARKSRLSERGVQKILTRLAEGQWLEIEAGGGRKNTHLYRLKTPNRAHPQNPEPSSPPNRVHPEPECRNPEPGSENPEPGSPKPSRTTIEPSFLPPIVPQGTVEGDSEPETDQFDEFWERYPRKDARKRAKAAYVKALKTHTHDDIMFGLSQHLPSLEAKELRFVPHAATWLNGDRFTETPETPEIGRPSDPHAQMFASMARVAARRSQGAAQ